MDKVFIVMEIEDLKNEKSVNRRIMRKGRMCYAKECSKKRKQHAERAGELWRTRSLFKEMKGEVSVAEIQCVRQKDRRWGGR